MLQPICRATHGQHIHAVVGDCAQGDRNALHNARVTMQALGDREVAAHAGAAEDQRALELALGIQRADAQANEVEHQVGVVALVKHQGHTHAGDFPALLLQMHLHSPLQRETRPSATTCLESS